MKIAHIMNMNFIIKKKQIMQINLFQIKKFIPYLGWVLLFLLLFFRGCYSSTPQNATVKVKEITKTLPVDTIIKHEVVNVEKIIKDRTNEKKLSKDILEMYDRIEAYEEQVDALHDYYKFADSLQKDSIFNLLTEIKKFESNFEDENLILKINGIIAKNEVKEITPIYTIKSKTIEVPQTKFRLLAGAGLGNSVTFDKPLFIGNVGFQNAKGNVLNFSFDSEQRILIGYNFSIFKVSK
jgi:hypothetical protein